MFVSMSPNINWKNHSNWSRTRQFFCPHFTQAHLSAASSDIGLHPLYINKHLIGGTAILSFGLWASKGVPSIQDNSGYGTFSITTIQGKGNHNVSFIAAYIAVNKGSNIGTESLYVQQYTIYENKQLKKGAHPKHFCPRIHAIKLLNQVIMELQQQQHGIILMLDANQSNVDCYNSTTIKPYSIEWLRIQRGMDDPFVQLMNSRPNSTTIFPNRDIDYVLTYGINVPNISTMGPNTLAHSDHQAIVLDLDLASFFSSKYSDLGSLSVWLLTSGNKKSYETYTSSVMEQIKTHKLDEHVQLLLNKAIDNPNSFSMDDVKQLNIIDPQLTDFMLSAEQKYCKHRNQRQFWSPFQRETARAFSYWKQKSIMESRKLIDWSQLNRLRTHTLISETDHMSLDPTLIYTKKERSYSQMESLQKKKCIDLSMLPTRASGIYGVKHELNWRKSSESHNEI
jgi:hypothetical protein